MSGIKARLYTCKIPLPLSLPYLKMTLCLFRREPLALINLKKKNEETGEEELAARLDHCKAKATRHIFLIRHSQYNLDGRADKDRTLTPLGREQAELTGRRLASLGLKFDQIIHSSMTRATETTEIISKHLPGKRLPLIFHCLLILKTASSRILSLSLKLRCYLAISQPCLNVCIYKETYSCNSPCFQFIF
uniref:Serine/threonine-protein phosphatase PGAM5, mitochondrial n=1 Tax=Ficedula albicollis TaxID=59894 RepID=A0A803VYK7_FICAL